jgi:hypothetical protein
MVERKMFDFEVSAWIRRNIFLRPTISSLEDSKIYIYISNLNLQGFLRRGKFSTLCAVEIVDSR